jgi:hypothetical protein
MAQLKRHDDGPVTAPGPLVVSQVNPRYFTVTSGDRAGSAVYLTGSHIWSNFHDGMGPGPACAGTPERLDFDRYLDFLQARGHNFIRLWRWEHFRSQAAGGDFHLCMTPQPWARTGPGNAKDGKPRFDLSRFDQDFFDRLRQRAVAAGEQGIYVGVMFFEGWGIHLSPAPDHVEGHPFHANNNLNGVGIESILDYQVLPLDPKVRELQEVYLRQVIDTVHDLPNVLYEVANESSGGGPVDEGMAAALGQSGTPEWGDSTQWQYWVIERVRRYTEERGYDSHPIGMTMQFPVKDQTRVNEPLLQSRADWISPGYDDEIFARGGHPMMPGSPQSRWLEDPPPADGRKVVITDTDHYAAGRGDALWAWKSFIRGHHPILMDFGIIGGVAPPDRSAGGPMSFEAFEAARWAMGDTVRLAGRLDLIEMEPRGELSSTGFMLANEGRAYVVLQPNGTTKPFTVTLEPGTYEAEWFSVQARETVEGDRVSIAARAARPFRPPDGVSGPAVLVLGAVSAVAGRLPSRRRAEPAGAPMASIRSDCGVGAIGGRWRAAGPAWAGVLSR